MPKVLCLHGYRQDTASFKTKTGGFRKLLKNRVEFDFINAPHVIPQGEQNPDGEDNCLSWWFSGDNPDYFSSKHVSDYVKGFDETLKLINDAFNKNGPYDGILGFSQGGSLALLLCLLKHFGVFENEFKFVILISAFESLTISHQDLYSKFGDEKLSIPSMHIIGQTDQIVSHCRSESLAKKYFKDPFVVMHPGGHTVPSQSSYKSQYLQFFDLLGLSNY